MSTAVGMGLAGCSGGGGNGNGDDDTTNVPPTTTETETTQSTTTETTTPSTTTEESTTATTPKLEIEQIVVPEAAGIDETFNIAVHIENSGNGDGIWDPEIFDTATRGTKPDDIDTTYPTWEPSVEVPAGESVVWKSPYISYAEPCNSYFKIGYGGKLRGTKIPRDKDPIVERANIVSEWGNYGDVIKNSIPAGETNSTIEFGFRFWYYEQQSLEVFEQVKIRDANNERVGLNQTTGEQLTEATGWGEWENALTFDTSDWDPGTYTAEVIIRDERTDAVSGGYTTDFEIVEDISNLQCTGAEVIDSDWPEQEPGNEAYDETPESLDVTLENTADMGGEVTLETRWSIYGVLVKPDRNSVEIGAGKIKDLTVESTPPREGTPVWHQVVKQDCNY